MTSTEPTQPSAAPSDGTGALVTLRSYITAIRSHPSVCRVAEHPWLIKCIDAWAIEKNRLAAARGLISLYFFNVWFTSLQMWWWGRQRFPLIWIFLVLPAVCLVIDWRIKLVAWVLMAEVLKDSVELLLQVLQTFFIRGVWYLNELMVKKLSMLGCTFLVLLMAHGKAKNPLAGLLMEELNTGLTTKQSVVLLVSRVLMTSLFIWAGQAEIKRQLASVHSDGMGHQIHDRPVGDGHDQLWAKCLQFLCAVPLCIGFRTRDFCVVLATVCLCEAIVQWTGLHWYGSGWIYDWANLGAFYRVHAREHFVVNVSVAGGLILLRNFGAGKFSVDEMMKKND